jgi:quercetin dioxygenase-like cupin family protein
MSTGYFSATRDDADRPTSRGFCADLENGPQLSIGPGLTVQPLLGERVMLNRVIWDERGEAPPHAHDEEQLVLVLEGAVELEFDGQVNVLGPGEACVIPPWTEHRAKARAARCVTIEAFGPPRAALLAFVPNGAELPRPTPLDG